MSRLRSQKLELQSYLPYLLAITLFYHVLFLFIYSWLILFDSWSNCTNFYSYWKLVITTGTQANKANANIKKQLVTVEAKMSKCWT